MIPGWELAIGNAIAMLRLGRKLGVADFHVSSTDPPPGLTRHGTLMRWFWPLCFEHDGAHLSSAHLATLLKRLDAVTLLERRSPVPYLAGLWVPHYVFTGRRR